MTHASFAAGADSVDLRADILPSIRCSRMATQQEEMKATIKDYILREFLPGESPDTLADTTPLISGGVLDSIATVKLINFLEREYKIRIEPHEINADYLDFLPDIAALVAAHRA
jgi:acyl carrier protein